MKNPKVDAYMARQKQWREESLKLRQIALDCGLTEELKWGKPCYAVDGSNVVLIQGFKAYCALLFFKGVLLKDPQGILVKTGANTRVGRQIRFTEVREITRLEAVVKGYIRQAIDVEKDGLTVAVERRPDPVPDELHTAFDADPALKQAFHALTPGRQRGYILHFSSAKQSKTRAARIAKCAADILAGKGMNEPPRSRSAVGTRAAT